MSEFLCQLIPLLAFLTGALLGTILYLWWGREQRRSYENAIKETETERNLLLGQISEKEKLVEENEKVRAELSSMMSESSSVNIALDQARQEILSLKNAAKVSPPLENNSELKIENDQLRKKIKKLKKNPKVQKEAAKDYYSEYQQFLSDLESTIKKAKKKTQKNSITSEKEKPKSNKSNKSPKSSKQKKKKKKVSKEKLAFYKEKFSNKKVDKSLESLLSKKASNKSDKKLSDLYGITHEIEKILNSEGISTFSDLSNTKIAALREILAVHDKNQKGIDPLNWPIQARIAEKGQWKILEEYKAKMKEGKKP